MSTPAYGSLSHHDEHLLYLSDRVAWAEYVAPWWLQQFAERGAEAVNELWPRLDNKGALRQTIWRLAGPDLRALISKERRVAPAVDTAQIPLI